MLQIQQPGSGDMVGMDQPHLQRGEQRLVSDCIGVAAAQDLTGAVVAGQSADSARTPYKAGGGLLGRRRLQGREPRSSSQQHTSLAAQFRWHYVSSRICTQSSLGST